MNSISFYSAKKMVTSSLTNKKPFHKYSRSNAQLLQKKRPYKNGIELNYSETYNNDNNL